MLPGSVSERGGKLPCEIISDLELLVANFKRQKARAEQPWPVDDADVPATIEEALAQGGIIVKRERAAALGVSDPRFMPEAKRGR